MNERIYIYDRSRNLVNDPERQAKYATGLRYESMWPKGYSTCSFNIRRDIALDWAVKGAYGVKVKDGLRTVYQGRLAGLQKAIQGTSETIDMRADGWYCVLVERLLRKRWVDNAAISLLKWPAARISATDQNELDSTKDRNHILVRAAYGDITRVGNEEYHEQYVLPKGSYVYKVMFNYGMRSGEGVAIVWYNDDQSAIEGGVSTITGSVETGSIDDVFANGNTGSFTLKFQITGADIYDEHDWIQVNDLAVYAQMASFASPTYVANEIGQDVLELVASDAISNNYDELGAPGLAIIPFTTMGDDFESADSILQRLASFGDSSQNTWGFSVWDDTGTSDSLPKAEFKARSVSSYDYIVNLRELNNFSDEEVHDEIKNWVVVKYTDTDDNEVWLTPDDDADLKDTTSIASYGQRHYLLDAGKCDSATAKLHAQRYLAYHKDPLHRMSFQLTGNIRQANGTPVPAGWVRAGERIKLLDWNGGETIFLRHAAYDAEAATLQVDRDVPPDTLATWLTQKKLTK